MSGNVQYVGRDLEAMSFAVNYHRWILELFQPYLGKRLVEVGAGTGSFSEMLLALPGLQSLTLVEPSIEMHAKLEGYAKQWAFPVKPKAHASVFRDVKGLIRTADRPDTMIYVNVLEHIEDDRGELRAVAETLEAGGRVCIFVPALPWLYGSFDEMIGHFRRYTKPELESKCREAGFRVLTSRYMDVCGMVPWWVKYCVWRSTKMEPGAVAWYDRWVVPVERVLEHWLPPCIGKNVLVVAEKV